MKCTVAFLYSGTLLVLLAVGLGGARYFARINTFLFLFLFGSILVTWFSMFFQPNGKNLGNSDYPNATYFRPSASLLRENLYPKFTPETCKKVFMAVFFGLLSSSFALSALCVA